jgi:hypothetical protein
VSSWVAVAVCWKRDINHAQARPGQRLASRTSATEKPSWEMFALARLESPVRRCYSRRAARVRCDRSTPAAVPHAHTRRPARRSRARPRAAFRQEVQHSSSRWGPTPVPAQVGVPRLWKIRRPLRRESRLLANPATADRRSRPCGVASSARCPPQDEPDDVDSHRLRSTWKPSYATVAHP